ncbi:hypothetical protein [Bradyrhizobium sp. CCBAU 53338]|uniref:hypothetical protein n=1 Tax=Bradyrhizobium sp. CCBAU 53338 TaxID=1325111 RepID=UPI00188D9CC9|nr:hypothetical protein [Bradyrhizobium sp. CCBAU 53338]
MPEHDLPVPDAPVIEADRPETGPAIRVRLTLSADGRVNGRHPDTLRNLPQPLLTLPPSTVSGEGWFQMTTIELPAASPPQAAAPARVRILCVLFFFSGFPALIYTCCHRHRNNPNQV